MTVLGEAASLSTGYDLRAANDLRGVETAGDQNSQVRSSSFLGEMLAAVWNSFRTAYICFRGHNKIGSVDGCCPRQ